MITATGSIAGINGNLVVAQFDGDVVQGEVAYAVLNGLRLKCEIIRVRGDRAEMQAFEDTSGLMVGSQVDFTGQLLSAELGPGLLGRVFDGLQNPLPELAEKHGFFLARGSYPDALDKSLKWSFTPTVTAGDEVRAGEAVGTVPEGLFTHRIMVPFGFDGVWTVESVAEEGDYSVEHEVARLARKDQNPVSVTMVQHWPIKIPITAYRDRLSPDEPMTTKIRVVDTFSPVAKGGTYCIPGPFGAGKTVIQHLTSRHADVDVVIVAACGERAGEVVELIRTFPEMTDPRTGKSLMDRTIIICNTSSMPVAAREASVYTAVTLAEYYRQMGLNVLLLADSTSRWAQALREMSGRLEEIPGEEAFPAYLESVIASFYERGGLVKLHDGSLGSVTIGGTVSPAGGNFEEPVTQSTLKVVGAFHGLSRERSDARRYPAINPLESWSKYRGVAEPEELQAARRVLVEGNEVGQMMKVVGEEGVGMADFALFLKAEFLDAVYLQQDAFHEVDGATPADRQKYVFHRIVEILKTPMRFEGREAARGFFQRLTQAVKDWNRVHMDAPDFEEQERRILDMVSEVREYA